MFASGAPHGVAGETAPTEELLRALELPAQYTALLVSGSNYLGAAPKPTGTVSYFETSPNNPGAGSRRHVRRRLLARPRTAARTGSSTTCDFGDGTHAIGKVAHHTYAAAGWYDVKLAVVKGQKPKWGTYRQTVKVGSPGAAAPATAACGTLTAAERTTFVDAAQKAVKKPAATAREN